MRTLLSTVLLVALSCDIYRWWGRARDVNKDGEMSSQVKERELVRQTEARDQTGRDFMSRNHLFSFDFRSSVYRLEARLQSVSQGAEMQKLRESVEQAELVFRQDPRRDKWEERRGGARRDGWGVFSRADGE